MAGDTETGVCIMAMNAGLDTGAVLLRQRVAIGTQDTAADLQARLSILGADLIVAALAGLPDLVPIPQPETGVSYAAKVDKSETRIDWTRPAIEVDRLIRALSPFPGAWCEIAGERVKLLGSKLADAQGTPGQVLHDFTVACANGAVQITQAQRPGKRPMPVDELLRGLSLPARLG